MKRPLLYAALAVLAGTLAALPEAALLLKAAVLFGLAGLLIKTPGRKTRLAAAVLMGVMFTLGFLRAAKVSAGFHTPEAEAFFSRYEATNPGQFDYALYLKGQGIGNEAELNASWEDRKKDGEESDRDRSNGKGSKKRVLPGDEIITVAAGFPTTVAPIIQYGAIPVFVDVTIPEYNIDVSKLEDALSDKTRAVMVAHTLGNPFDLRAVKAFCDKHGLWLIEDNCDALGSRYEMDDGWHFTGTVGDIGTSSFYPPHHMTMGEGGAVYTNDPRLNKIARSLRDWGRDCVCPSGKDNLCGHRFDRQYGELPFGYDHKYVYSHFGYNLKATDMQAAVGCAQLEKFPSFVERRKNNFKHLYDGLKKQSADKGFDLEDKLILPKASEHSDPSWFGFMMTCRDGVGRKEIVEKIEKAGIQTRALFAGNLTKHPCFDEMRRTGKGFRIAGDLHNTDEIMERSFWVGVYPGMTDEMIDYMCENIVEVIIRIN